MNNQRNTEEKLFNIIVKATKKNKNIEVVYKEQFREINIIYKNELLSKVKTDCSNIFDDEKDFSIFIKSNFMTTQSIIVHEVLEEMSKDIESFITNSVKDTIELIEQRRKERNIEDNFILKSIKEIPNLTYDSCSCTLEYKGYDLYITIKDENVFTFLSIGEQWGDGVSKEIDINKAIRIIDILNEKN